MNALIDRTNLTPQFGKNQAGITLHEDGSFIVWNTYDDPSNPTEQQIDQTRKLMGLAAALKAPSLMEVLLQVADDVEIWPDVLKRGAVI